MKNSLKTMFLVVLGMVLTLLPAKKAMAMEEVFPNDPSVYPAKVTVFMYSSKESSPNIHVITFYNEDTGEEFIFKMNKYNYGFEDVWRDQIFLPEGSYFVRGNIFQDTWATFTMYTPTEEITISADKNTPLYCMMGTPDFIAQNKFTMDDIIAENPLDGKKDSEPEYASESDWLDFCEPENCNFTYAMYFERPEDFFTMSFLVKYKGQYEEIADWIIEKRARIDYNTGTDPNEKYYNISKEEILNVIETVLKQDSYYYYQAYGVFPDDASKPTTAPKPTTGVTDVTPVITQPAGQNENPDTIKPAATPTPVPEESGNSDKGLPLPAVITGGVIIVLALLLFAVNTISKRRR